MNDTIVNLLGGAPKAHEVYSESSDVPAFPADAAPEARMACASVGGT